MLRYFKSRYAASVAARARAEIAQFLQRDRQEGLGGVGGWDGNGDPFVHHAAAAIAALSEGVAAVYGYGVPGDIAEFGTMSGRTSEGIARAMASCDQYLRYASEIFNVGSRKLFLFDSFVGFPNVASSSVDGRSPHVREGVWSAGSQVGISAGALSDRIRVHLPFERFSIIPGWFSDTIPALPSSRRFALLHLDCDLHKSTMDVLESLLSRGMISAGAYLYFDDWNCNAADPEFGERRAWRECVEKYHIIFSDLGSYGIFSWRLVVHSYDGSPAPRRDEVSGNEPLGSPGQSVATATMTTSTDRYDHQAASRHYHESTGMADMDPSFLPIYERCREFSMTSAERLFSVYKAVQYLSQGEIEGDIVECGVWRGGSMMVAAEALKLFPGPERVIYLFDTFEGLPAPAGEDFDVWGNDARVWWEKKRTSVQSSDWARAHLEEVRANLARTGFSDGRVRFVKGMVEDTVPNDAPDRIALLRLDTDWYRSTKHELVHLFPRLVAHGVLIIDDYGHFRGAKQAVDEYFSESRVPIMLVRVDYTGRVAVKVPVAVNCGFSGSGT
jgi:O-methyltransferase